LWNSELIVTGSAVVAHGYQSPFLAEQKKSLQAKWSELQRELPVSEGSLITAAEGKLVVAALHLQRLCEAQQQGVDYIERMLWDQVSHYGKES
jgi:hypothetical protein